VTRAVLYLLASGAIWLVEGFLFSHFLGFGTWQTVIMAVLYAALFLTACAVLIQHLRRWTVSGAPVSWRLLSAAPMVVAVLGSFLTLPLLLLILAAGRIA
jgi:hypothetical protein